MTRDELLTEGVVAKFLRYVAFDTRANEDSDDVPSTPGQRELALRLKEELFLMGLEDAYVDDGCIVTAGYNGPVKDCPAIGFIAHMDTAPGVPGNSVKAVVHRNYQGGDIILASGLVISPFTSPDLKKAIGHDIITSEGETLLGADDKAGIAEIMEAVCRLVKSREPQCGKVKMAFTCDEEIGRGVSRLKVSDLKADVAYTLDGGIAGEVEDENFNARNLRLSIFGRSAHPGKARGVMINAMHIAAQLIAAIPAERRPETTDGRAGFIHPTFIHGDVEQAELKLIIRDFEEKGLAELNAMVIGICEDLMRRFPGSLIQTTDTGGYRNMKSYLSVTPKVIALALEAIRDAGIEPVVRSIRGGTDGAQLSTMGLPTPNLFTGGANFHSRSEWISVQWMEKAVDVVVNLCRRWAGEKSVKAD